MIPRRRIPFELSTLIEVLRELFRAARFENSVTNFELAFATYLNSKHAHATASGRDALGLILDGLGLKPGDEIVIPAYTLGELLPLLQGRGLVLKPADIELDSFNMSVESIREQITKKTAAVLIVHLHGAPCDISAIMAVAREYGIKVVEDCAHALGAEVEGKKVGTFGDAALFSLEVNKPVCAFGGGVVTTNDDGLSTFIDKQLAKRCKKKIPAIKKILIKYAEELFVRSPFYGPVARVLFSEKNARKFEKAYRGANTRVRKSAIAFSPLQARLALRSLQKIDVRNARLNRLWGEIGDELPSTMVLQNRSAVGIPAFYNMVVRCTHPAGEIREQVMSRGVDLGLGSEIMDNTASMLGVDSCVNVNAVASSALLLPVYDGLTERRKRRLIAILTQVSESRSDG